MFMNGCEGGTRAEALTASGLWGYMYSAAALQVLDLTTESFFPNLMVVREVAVNP